MAGFYVMTTGFYVMMAGFKFSFKTIKKLIPNELLDSIGNTFS
jgi:hypothetical protein